MTRLIHITPELPPTVGGVADYTALLSRRIVEVSEGTVEPVLVCAGSQNAETIDVGFPAVNLGGRCSTSALAKCVAELSNEAKGQAAVLLEYSGYTYSTRGVPLWLVRSIDRITKNEGVPVVTMFHELYATGPPWTSAFWTSPFQYYVAARLARLSQKILTNQTWAVAWLNKWQSATNVPVTFNPICSNVGEPQTRPSFESREADAVVFGGAGRKPLIYNSNRAAVEALLERYEIDTVLDIGPTNSKTREAARGLPVHFEGVLPCSDVSERLRNARLGLVSYPVSRLAKSGSVAAFLSHGIPTVVFDEGHGRGPSTPYDPGTHYIEGQDIDTQGEGVDLASISRAAFEQYQESSHSILHAKRILRLLEEASTETKEIAP